MAGALRQLRDLDITMPTAPTRTTNEMGNYTPLSAVDEHIFKRKFDAKYTQELKYDENKKGHMPCFLSNASQAENINEGW